MALNLSQMPTDSAGQEDEKVPAPSPSTQSSHQKDPIEQGKDPPMSKPEKPILKVLPMSQTHTKQSIPDIVKEAVESENVLKENHQDSLKDDLHNPSTSDDKSLKEVEMNLSVQEEIKKSLSEKGNESPSSMVIDQIHINEGSEPNAENEKTPEKHIGDGKNPNNTLIPPKEDSATPASEKNTCNNISNNEKIVDGIAQEKSESDRLETVSSEALERKAERQPDDNSDAKVSESFAEKTVTLCPSSNTNEEIEIPKCSSEAVDSELVATDSNVTETRSKLASDERMKCDEEIDNNVSEVTESMCAEQVDAPSETQVQSQTNQDLSMLDVEMDDASAINISEAEKEEGESEPLSNKEEEEGESEQLSNIQALESGESDEKMEDESTSPGDTVELCNVAVEDTEDCEQDSHNPDIKSHTEKQENQDESESSSQQSEVKTQASESQPNSILSILETPPAPVSESKMTDNSTETDVNGSHVNEMSIEDSEPLLDLTRKDSDATQKIVCSDTNTQHSESIADSPLPSVDEVKQTDSEPTVPVQEPTQDQPIALTTKKSSIDSKDTSGAPILKIPSYSAPPLPSQPAPLNLTNANSSSSISRSLPLPAHSVTTKTASQTSHPQPPPAHSATTPQSLVRHVAPSSVHTNHVGSRSSSGLHPSNSPGSNTIGQAPHITVGTKKKQSAPAALGKAPPDTADKQCLDDNGNNLTPEMQKMARDKDQALKAGKDVSRPVGWTTIAGTIMPYIMRGSTKYVSVKMVESKLLAKYPNIDLDEMAEASPIYSYYCSETEGKLLTEINARCYSHAFGSEPFTTKDLIVSLGDFEKFYKNIQVHFKKLEMEKAAVAARNAKRIAQRGQTQKITTGGWLQINNTIVPYVVRGGIKYVPVAVVKYAARLLLGIDLAKHQIMPHAEDIMVLNRMCKGAGVMFTFDMQKTKLIKVEMVVRLNKVRVSIKELPKKNPFDHGVYDEEIEVMKEAHGIPRTKPPPHGKSQQKSIVLPSRPAPLLKAAPPLKSGPATPQARPPPLLQASTSRPGPPVKQVMPMRQGPPPVRQMGSLPPNSAENAALLQLRQMVNAKVAPPALSPQNLSRTTPPTSASHLPPQVQPPHLKSAVQLPAQKLPPSSTPQPITIAPLDPNQIPGAPPEHDLRPPMPINIEPDVPPHFPYFPPGPPRPQFRPDMGGPMHFHNARPHPRLQGPPPLRHIGNQQMSRPFMERAPPPYPMGRPPMSYAMALQRSLRQSEPHSAQMQGLAHPSSMVSVGGVQKPHMQPSMSQPPNFSKSPVPTPKAVAPNEPLIKPVRLSGKTVSCILRRDVGQRYALVEALARLYFPQCTLQEFQKVLKDDLNLPLEELSTSEEQEFIKFYDLPVKSLKCKTVAPIGKFEGVFQQLRFIFKDKLSPAKQKGRSSSTSSSGAPSPGASRRPSSGPGNNLTPNSIPSPHDADGVGNNSSSRSSTPSEASMPLKRPSSVDSNSGAPPQKKVKTLGNVLAKLKQRQEATLAPKDMY